MASEAKGRGFDPRQPHHFRFKTLIEFEDIDSVKKKKAKRFLRARQIKFNLQIAVF